MRQIEKEVERCAKFLKGAGVEGVAAFQTWALRSLENYFYSPEDVGWNGEIKQEKR